MRFDKLKQGSVGTTLDVLEFYGLDRKPDFQQKIQSLYDAKYSFEAMTNHLRGSEGEIIRSRYMVRKSVLGKVSIFAEFKYYIIWLVFKI
jgi:hypothetical protein